MYARVATLAWFQVGICSGILGICEGICIEYVRWKYVCMYERAEYVYMCMIGMCYMYERAECVYMYSRNMYVCTLAWNMCICTIGICIYVHSRRICVYVR